jgi:OOP family OmpA-OmpF porin
MSVMKAIKLASSVLAAALAVACAGPEPVQSGRSPKLPDPGPDKEYRVQFPDLGRGKARYIVLTLGDDVAKSCGQVKAHFEFDSAEPLPQDQIVLRMLADCLNQPSLQDKAISLMGGTDDRGAPGYNQALGLRRAEHVKQILVDAGVAADRIHTASRGESGAVGAEPQYSYQYDRRVDVALMGTVHAPSR